MSKLKNKFESIYQKFVENRAYFQGKMKTWQQKGYEDAYQHGSRLLRDIEQNAQNIKQEMSLNLEETSSLKQKIKTLKCLYKELRELVKPAWQQWIEAIFTALFLATVLRHTIFSPYHVPTGSAEPTILVGDRIWGNKLAYLFSEVKHGDYIICDDPQYLYGNVNILQRIWQRFVGFPIPMLGLKAGPISITKRVIAVPGDTLEGRVEDGKTALYLNGKKLEEPYLNMLPLIEVRRTTGFFPFDHVGALAIPEFLQKKTKKIPYVYDPSKPYAEQPYYYMTEDDIVKNAHGKQRLHWPLTPNVYHLGFGREVTIDNFGPYTLPEGMYWGMGDNRKNSGDSRSFGPVPRNLIRGRVSFVLFSLDSEEVFWLFDLVKHPIDFWTKHVRWNRFFKPIR